MEPEYKGCFANTEELNTGWSIWGNPTWGQQHCQLSGSQPPPSVLPHAPAALSVSPGPVPCLPPCHPAKADSNHSPKKQQVGRHCLQSKL